MGSFEDTRREEQEETFNEIMSSLHEINSQLDKNNNILELLLKALTERREC